MRPAVSIKRDITLALAISGLVFLCALFWGGPFISTASGATKVQTGQSQTQSTTFTGIVVHSDGQFVLNDPTGHTYRLDDAQRAQPFQGQSVKVTGQLDKAAGLIHIEGIAPVV